MVFENKEIEVLKCEFDDGIEYYVNFMTYLCYSLIFIKTMCFACLYLCIINDKA